MIFVTLGTQDKSFHRLLDEIDMLINEGKITEPVIVQAGITKFSSPNMEIFDFTNMDTFNKYVHDCNLLITHGGVGSILAGITSGKKVLAVARRFEHNEHENNHQIEIINKFVEYGYILGCIELKDFSKKIEEINEFVPTTYGRNNNIFCNKIIELIEN